GGGEALTQVLAPLAAGPGCGRSYWSAMPVIAAPAIGGALCAPAVWASNTPAEIPPSTRQVLVNARIQPSPRGYFWRRAAKTGEGQPRFRGVRRPGWPAGNRARP